MMYEPMAAREYKTEQDLRQDYNRIHRKFFDQASDKIIRQAEKDQKTVEFLRDQVERQLAEIRSLIRRTEDYQTEIDNLRCGIVDKRAEVLRLRAEQRAASAEVIIEGTTLDFPRVLAVVSAVYGVNPRDVKGPSRTRQLASARRHIIHILTDRRPDLSLPVIGKLLGGRDHSTILHARDSWAGVKNNFLRQIAEVDGFLGQPVDNVQNSAITQQVSPCSDKILACG